MRACVLLIAVGLLATTVGGAALTGVLPGLLRGHGHHLMDYDTHDDASRVSRSTK